MLLCYKTGSVVFHCKRGSASHQAKEVLLMDWSEFFLLHLCWINLILDESADYLDHDTLSAFEWVIDSFDDSIMIIGNNNEFWYRLYSETWVIDANHYWNERKWLDTVLKTSWKHRESIQVRYYCGNILVMFYHLGWY